MRAQAGVRLSAVATAVAAMAALASCAPSNDTRVIDGATVKIRGATIALHQIVAPKEKDAKCDAEREAAVKARERFAELLANAKEVTARKTGMACLDVTTCDGFVEVDGEDVGDTLTREGLVVNTFYRGLDAEPYDWCATPREPLPPPAVLDQGDAGEDVDPPALMNDYEPFPPENLAPPSGPVETIPPAP
ncbi:MAG: hypothetical protein R3C52_01210 [Hyphomonadaceae bacterium]